MLDFIKSKTNKDINSSTDWGNYSNSKFTFTGKYSKDNGKTWNDGKDKEKPKDSKWLLTTGASDINQAQNIYDVAGNVGEWTMDAHSSNSRGRRGGHYDNYGTYYPASSRLYNYPYYCNTYFGFRPALYITNQSN